jgi:hypothetical protein
MPTIGKQEATTDIWNALINSKPRAIVKEIDIDKSNKVVNISYEIGSTSLTEEVTPTECNLDTDALLSRYNYSDLSKGSEVELRVNEAEEYIHVELRKQRYLSLPLQSEKSQMSATLIFMSICYAIASALVVII